MDKNVATSFADQLRERSERMKRKAEDDLQSDSAKRSNLSHVPSLISGTDVFGKEHCEYTIALYSAKLTRMEQIPPLYLPCQCSLLPTPMVLFELLVLEADKR